MNKQNRSGMGGAPAPEKTEFVGGSPINSAVPQGGFTKERGGNLRDHNGMKANPAAIAATEHYDGDYGVGSLGGGSGPKTIISGQSGTAGGMSGSGSVGGGMSGSGTVSRVATPVLGGTPVRGRSR